MENENAQAIDNTAVDTKVTKKAIIVCAVALGITVALCIMVLFIVFAPSKYVTLKHDIFRNALSGNVFVDDTIVMSTSGDQMSNVPSVDGSVAYVLDDSTLYVVDAERKTAKQIGTNVANAVISPSGNAIVFVDKDQNLKIYYVKSGKTKQIASGVQSDAIVVSQNAKSVAFTKKEDDVIAYVWKNNKTKKLDDDLNPVSITDDAKTVICRKITNGGLYSYNFSGKSVKLAEKVNSYFTVNYSGTEILFSDDENTYISLNGGEPIKLFAGSSVSVLAEKNYNVSLMTYQNSTNISAAKTFKNKVFMSFDYETYLYKVCRISDKFEGEVLLDGVFTAMLTENSKTIVAEVECNDDLYNVVSYNISKKTSKTVCERARNFSIAPNGIIYVITEDRTLNMIKNGKTTKLSENVRVLESVNNGYLYYLDTDGALSKAKFGSKKSKKIADDIGVIGTYGINLIAYDNKSEVVVFK